jgi:ribosome-binding factor A
MTMAGDGIRGARVAERIRAELARILSREVSDPRLEGVFVTRVVVAGDLQVAWVYLSLGHQDSDASRKRAIAGTRAAKGRLRTLLGSTLGLRRVPELRFAFDEAIEEQRRIMDLLDEVEPSTER